MINEITYPVAFGAGLVSFFAPCMIPLLPAYISYVAGVSLHELKKDNFHKYSRKIFFSSVFYVLGFSLLFVAIGTAAASISSYFYNYKELIQRIGGLMIVILGIQFAGFLNSTALIKERRFRLPRWAEHLGYLRSFVIGLIFASAWSTCVGVVYGAILSLAAISGTAMKGASLLFVYSLGISIPFLFVSMTLAIAPTYLKPIQEYSTTIVRVFGIILIILGLLLFTNTYPGLYNWRYQ